MFDANEIAKLVEVSKMYYEENMTQSDIANKINVSRPLVSKMLSKAKELGIVKIEIRSIYSNNDSLLNEIKESFNLSDGIVVPQSKTDYITKQSVLSQAYSYIKGFFEENIKIGIGWGYGIRELVNEFVKAPDNLIYGGEVFPLIGTANIPNKGYHPNELIMDFANNTGLTPMYMYAPAFPTSNEEKNIYTSTSNYIELNKKWNEIDICIMCIGNFPSVPDEATAVRFGRKLIEEKAIGSFLSYYFDKNGKIIESNDDHVVHIPLDKLFKSKVVIALCLDCSTDAIIGAIKTGVISHIIIDEKKAKEILVNYMSLK